MATNLEVSLQPPYNARR